MFLHFDIRLGIIVVVLALLQGGRYERLTALLFAIRGGLNLLAPKWDWWDVADWRRLTLFQGAFLALLLLVAWRHRARWLLAIVALQAATVGLEIWCTLDPARSPPLMPVFYVLAIGKSLCLAWAVARRWIAPPRAAPAPGKPDVDLYERALARRGRAS